MAWPKTERRSIFCRQYRTNCCYGLAMDLLENIAHELEFDFHLYVVSDGVFGSQVHDHQYHDHKPYYASGQPQHAQQSNHLEQDLTPKNTPPPGAPSGQQVRFQRVQYTARGETT